MNRTLNLNSINHWDRLRNFKSAIECNRIDVYEKGWIASIHYFFVSGATSSLDFLFKCLAKCRMRLIVCATRYLRSRDLIWPAALIAIAYVIL